MRSCLSAGGHSHPDRVALCMQTRRLGLLRRTRHLSFVAVINCCRCRWGWRQIKTCSTLDGNTIQPVRNLLLKIACTGQPVHPRLLRGLLRLLTWRPCRPGCIRNTYCAASSLPKCAHSAGEQQVLTCSSSVSVGTATLLLRANMLQEWTERTG